MKKFSTLVLSFFAVIYFAQGQTFFASPSNTTICQGESTVFSAFYSDGGSGNGASIRWTFDGSTFTSSGVGPNGETITLSAYGGGDALLTMTIQNTVAASAASDVKVEVLNSVPAVIATSSPDATLTVNSPPSVTVHPSDVTDCNNITGKTMDVTIGSSANIQWQRDEGSGFSNLTNTGNMSGVSCTSCTTQTLTFGTGTDDNTDGDVYRAKVTMVGCPDAESNTADLTVLGDLSSQSNFTGGTINAGATASFFETFQNTSSVTEYTVTFPAGILDNAPIDNHTVIGDGASEFFDNVVIGGLHQADITVTTTNLAPGTTQLTVQINNNDQGGTGNTISDFNITVAGEKPCGGVVTKTESFTALPIELIYFRGSLSDETVVLDWATGSELGNDYFTIERSFDGQSFMSIGEVKGEGNSFTEVKYQFVDGSINPSESNGQVYYRLKQTDFDGGFAYVDMISVELKGNAIFDIKGVQLEGNNLSVDYSSPATLDITATIYDLNGRLLNTFTTHPAVGFNNEIIDLSNLKPGFYILSMENGNQQASKKFVKF